MSDQCSSICRLYVTDWVSVSWFFDFGNVIEDARYSTIILTKDCALSVVGIVNTAPLASQ